jgi:probable HAF family extracellular repeat protein
MRRISCVLVLVAAAGCYDEPQPTEPMPASSKRVSNARYEVVKLTESLGGTLSLGSAINNRGWVAGYSSEVGQTRHAALWRDGVIEDLGTLGGPNSAVQWPGLNNGGMVVGISQTSILDTLGEDWSCGAFLPASDRTCVGFVWDDGVMEALPTLGGDHGFATSVNDLGQVVGWAETTVEDPTCNEPQVLQFHAVMWEPRKNGMVELPPLPGDSTSAATAINQRGQVVGISGECDIAVGRFSARHAVLWEHGRVREIGNLGGVSWHTPMAINERGDVVGFSNPPGDEDGSFNARAFLFTRDGRTIDLKTLPGDETSQALGINSRGDVVGVSSGPNGNRAVVWLDGKLLDLNALVGAEFSDSLVTAEHINDAGQITGRLIDLGTGTSHPFVATPVGRRQ